MVDRNLLRSLDDDDLFGETNVALEIADDLEEFDKWLVGQDAEIDVEKIVDGKILRVDNDTVLVDVGYKSEGTIPLHEWDPLEDPPEVGAVIPVLVEEVESALAGAEEAMVSLSYKKAKERQEWERIIHNMKENDVITGRVVRKIKGGLLVDIGVKVFLPASQVDIRRPHDIGEYIGNALCSVKC